MADMFWPWGFFNIFTQQWQYCKKSQGQWKEALDMEPTGLRCVSYNVKELN